VQRNDRVRRAAWAALLGMGLVAFGHLCVAKGGDFLAFYDAGEAALLRGDVYAHGPRMHMNVFYAPSFSLLMAPLALLPPYLAGWLWYLAKLAAVAYLVRWLDGALRREVPGLGARARWAYLGLPFLVALNPFMSEFRLGQANLFVLLFTLLTVRALERGRPIVAAFLFSVAALKITAIALVPWLVLRRQWRFLGGLLIAGAAWIAVLAAWWGPGHVLELFATWLRITASAKAIPRIIAFFENQSLQGVAYRLAERFPGLERPVLGVAAVQWLWILPCLAILGVLALAAARDRLHPRLPPEEFALGSLLMLLASSDSRWAHHVQLYVPLAVLTALAARSRLLEAAPGLGRWLAAGATVPAPAPEGARLRRTLAALLLAGVVVLVVMGRDVVGPTVNHAVRMLSLPAAFDVALAIFLSARLLRRAAPQAVEAPVASLSHAP
jgi:hypothetical protein